MIGTEEIERRKTEVDKHIAAKKKQHEKEIRERVTVGSRKKDT